MASVILSLVNAPTPERTHPLFKVPTFLTPIAFNKPLTPAAEAAAVQSSQVGVSPSRPSLRNLSSIVGPSICMASNRAGPANAPTTPPPGPAINVPTAAPPTLVAKEPTN